MSSGSLESIYQIWGAADDEDSPRFRYMHLDYPDFEKSSHEINWREFWTGQRLSESMGRHLRFELLSSRGPCLPDFRQSICGWILMSSKLRALLERHAKGLEYQWIDPLITYPDSDSQKMDYKLFNSLTHVPCLNAEKSKIDYCADGSTGGLGRICLDRKRIEPVRGIFRLAEDSLILLVTGDLYDALILNGITGFAADSIALT